MLFPLLHSQAQDAFHWPDKDAFFDDSRIVARLFYCAIG